MFNDFFKAISQPISSAAHVIAQDTARAARAAGGELVRQGQAQLQAEINKEISKGAVSLASMLFSSAATDGTSSDI